MHRRVALLVVAASLAGCAVDPPGAPQDATADGTGSVAWSFTDTDGVVHSNATAAGEPVLFFFMASWCTTCRSKAPMLAEVHDDYAPRGLQAFSVSFDPRDDEATLEAWKAEHGNAWPHGVDPGLAVQRAFGVRSQSSVVVLDGDGQVVRQWGYPGPREAELRATLEPLFPA